MRRPEPTEYHSDYAGYISLVPESDIIAALTAQLAQTQEMFRGVDESRAGHRYAPGKWSIREVAGHMSDGERVFGYRAFAIARGETALLPSFDENPYVAASGYDTWSMRDLIDTFTALRTANLITLRALDEEAWSRVGNANGHPVTPRAIAFTLVGHERHHSKVLRERYLS
jgi:hypothetical protein